MASTTVYTVEHRRKREGKTDYKARLKLLSSGMTRVVARKSLRYIWFQAVQYSPDGDKVLITAHSKELAKYGWKGNSSNMPSAYLTGLLFAKKAKSHKISKAVYDIGRQVSVKGNVLYAGLKGIIDGGLAVAHSKEVLPDDSRVSGKHISDFAKKIKENKQLYDRTFGLYLKNKIDPENIPKLFEDVKKKLVAA